MQARRAVLKLTYNGTDITEDITEDLSTATWTDKADAGADELSVTLHNAHGRWSGDWFPAKGAKLSAEIEVIGWGGDGYRASLPCGTFEIDEIELSGGSSGSKATIKAISAPVSSASRGEAKTRAWQDVALSEIAADAAKNAGLSLVFELEDDPHYEREDQSHETDLSFLLGLCRDAGCALKVTHDKLVVFSRESREAADAVLTITPAMCEMWRFKSKSSKVYKSARVEYHDPETDEDYEYETDAELADLSGEDINGRTLVIESRVKSEGEAERLAKNALADANRSEVTGSFSTMGDVRLVAGVNVMLEGFGRFDGRYAIESASHTIGSKYSVSVNITRARGQSAKRDSTKAAEQNDPQWKDYSAYGQEIYR